MDKHSTLHSLVFFVDRIDEASDFYSRLTQTSISNKGDLFIKLQGKLFDLGFHPADEKGSNGLAVSYWKVDSIDKAIESSVAYGFDLYRGPLTVDSIRVAQIRDAHGMVIGLVEEHG